MFILFIQDVDFQRNKFSKNVFICLLFEQQMGKNRKVRSFFEVVCEF